jgi:hypothetical protein
VALCGLMRRRRAQKAGAGCNGSGGEAVARGARLAANMHGEVERGAGLRRPAQVCHWEQRARSRFECGRG